MCHLLIYCLIVVFYYLCSHDGKHGVGQGQRRGSESLLTAGSLGVTSVLVHFIGLKTNPALWR